MHAHLLQVVDPGDASIGKLPAIKLVIDNQEEELDDGEGEILDLNDRLLGDPQLFGLGGGRYIQVGIAVSNFIQAIHEHVV